MKPYILLILLSITSLSSTGQTLEGTYSNKWVSTSGEGVAYTLTLEANGQFTFDYRRVLVGTDDYRSEVTGTWKLEGHLLTLTSKEGTDSELVSKLDGNRARFVSVSPRHPDFNLVKPSLNFYKSDIFYVRNMALTKVETSVTASD